MEYEPGRHSGQVTAPDDPDDDPAEQAVHVIAPALALWVPVRHLEHVVRPVAFEYVPGMHEEHLVAADGDAVEDPAAQVWHIVDPVAYEYVPAAHGVHGVFPVEEQVPGISNATETEPQKQQSMRIIPNNNTHHRGHASGKSCECVRRYE